jgi:hypothetical protein
MCYRCTKQFIVRHDRNEWPAVMVGLRMLWDVIFSTTESGSRTVLNHAANRIEDQLTDFFEYIGIQKACNHLFLRFFWLHLLLSNSLMSV